MKSIRQLLLMPLIFFMLSCATVPGAITSVGTDVAALTRREANRLAVVQILLVRRGELVTGGSGCLVSPDGHILTARHIVGSVRADSSIEIRVNFQNRLYPARPVCANVARDLAVIKVTARTALPCVRFAHAGFPETSARVTFSAVPPQWGQYRRGRYVKPVIRLEKNNHQPVPIHSVQDLVSLPVLKGFLENHEVRRIIENPRAVAMYDHSQGVDQPSLGPDERAVLDFFLPQLASRVFLLDPDQKMLSGFSGGVWFDEDGNCIGLFQEILVSFKPNPASRYINPRHPPKENLRFALIDKMICAGQSTEGIRAFLEEMGIEVSGNSYKSLP